MKYLGFLLLFLASCRSGEPLSGVEIEITTQNKGFSTPYTSMSTPQVNVIRLVPIGRSPLYQFTIECNRNLRISEVVKTNDGVNYFPTTKSKIFNIKIEGEVWVQYESCVDHYY